MGRGRGKRAGEGGGEGGQSVYVYLYTGVCVCLLLACLTSPPLSASLTRLWEVSAALGRGGGEVRGWRGVDSLYIFVHVSVCVCWLVGWLLNISTTLRFPCKAVGGQCSPGEGGRGEGRLGGGGDGQSVCIYLYRSLCVSVGWLVACLLNVSTTLRFSYKTVGGQCSPGRGGGGEVRGWRRMDSLYIYI